jgi:hypothetical protein
LSGEPLTIHVEFEASTATEGVVFVLQISSSEAGILVRTDTDELGQEFDVPVGHGAIEFSFDSIPLLDGAFDVTVGIQSRLGGVLYDWQEPASRFEVMNPGKTTGFLNLPHQVAMVPVSSEVNAG